MDSKNLCKVSANIWLDILLMCLDYLKDQGGVYMLKPINKAAKMVLSSAIVNNRCGDVCVFCDEPRDGCQKCDMEPCIIRDFD